MAYFFVLKSQNSVNVRWCRGEIGEVIFQRWVDYLEGLGVIVLTDTKCVGFKAEGDDDRITSVSCAFHTTSFQCLRWESVPSMPYPVPAHSYLDTRVLELNVPS